MSTTRRACRYWTPLAAREPECRHRAALAARGLPEEPA